jgi:hypothetical protein
MRLTHRVALDAAFPSRAAPNSDILDHLGLRTATLTFFTRRSVGSERDWTASLPGGRRHAKGNLRHSIRIEVPGALMSSYAIST